MSIPSEWLRPANLRAGTGVQREIANAVERRDRIGEVRSIAGVDTSMKWRDTRGPIHAAVAPVDWPARVPQTPQSLTVIPAFPYVPGYLSFRETPPILDVLEAMDVRPDLLFVDGHGLAHPRRCGIASHLGVVADIATIGCGKSLLCGKVEGVIGPAAGATAPLVDRGEQVGVALRTRAGAKPIYISTGHRISLETAITWVMALSDGRRLPLPIRCAHDAANAARRAAEATRA